ncbi:MAG: glycosyltransferase [Granulicella sp.]
MHEILQPSDLFTEPELPYISVVIPVRCELAGLSLLLPELMNQDYPAHRWEIIVADGESTDRTPELVRQFAQNASIPIRLLRNKGIRSSAGRNVGILAAQGDIIVFIDGHCRVPSRSLLSKTAQIFRETGADCLCRPQPLGGSPAHPMSGYIAEIRRSTFGHGRGSMIYNVDFAGFVDPRSSGASYRRSVFEQIGLYDECFDACEDVELNARVAQYGMQAYTDPSLAIEYQARNSFFALAKQMMRYGRGRLRLARKHHGERSLSSLAPFVLCLSFVAPLLLMTNGLLMRISMIPALLYMAAVLVATLQLVVRTRRIQLAWGLIIYPLIHLSLGAGMLMEAASLCLRAPHGWVSRQEIE